MRARALALVVVVACSASDSDGLSDATSSGVPTFGCGALECEVDNQYCQLALSDVSGMPDVYACRAMPINCPDPAVCDCLSEEPCFMPNFCEDIGGGNLQLTCPGP